jgi:CHAT domain-containing protein
LEQVQAAIPEQTVLLEIIRYRHYLGKARRQESYGTLVLSRREAPRWVSFGPADVIERSIKLYQHAVRCSAAPEELASLLHDLYQRVWAPLSEALPDRTAQVIVSPDGEMNFISFATLLAPVGRFLGEEYLFGYVGSGRDLLADNNPAPTTSTLLIWANPDFGGCGLPWRAQAVRQHELHELNLRLLPGAEKEGRALYDHARQLGFRDAVLYLGTNATESELHRVHSPKTIHFATHGFMLPEPDNPNRVGDDDAGTETLNFAVHKLNPMHRCGLALAGAQRTLQAWAEGTIVTTDNDGIVTADEIGGLDLRGTQLVVLSACDTGTGEARAGEGVLGLRRGFVQAGAQNLLLTLWPMDDRQTFGFMPDFYADVEKNGTPWKALARVQRSWLKKLRTEQGIAEACRIAGPFILSFQGKPQN